VAVIAANLTASASAFAPPATWRWLDISDWLTNADRAQCWWRPGDVCVAAMLRNLIKNQAAAAREPVEQPTSLELSSLKNYKTANALRVTFRPRGFTGPTNDR